MNKKGLAPLWIVLIIVVILGSTTVILEVTDVINIIPKTDKLCEPNTLEGYNIMCDWTINNEQNTKCHLSEGKPSGNDLEITWGSIPDVGEGDVVLTPSTEVNLGNQDLITERTRNGIDIFSFSGGDSKFFLFCNLNKIEYISSDGIKEDNICLLYENTVIEERYFEEFGC